MTRTRSLRRRSLLVAAYGAWLCATLLGATGSAVAAEPSGDEADAVLHLLAQRKHGEVSFVEQHFLALLKRPTESLGELVYDAPDRLEKRTLEPRAESLSLVGDTLTLQRGSKTRVLDLHAFPEIRPFVESIRATLAGDRTALERIFRVEFAGNMARWNLTLLPLDARLAKSVERIQIDGARDNLLKVEIKQTDGDRSLMTLRAHALK